MTQLFSRCYRPLFIISVFLVLFESPVVGQTPSVTPTPFATPGSPEASAKEIIQQRLSAVLPSAGALTTSAQRYFVQVDRSALRGLALKAGVNQYSDQLIEESLLELYGDIKIKFPGAFSGSYALQVLAGSSLGAISGIADTTPDILMEFRGVPNDPMFPEQLNLHNTGNGVDIDAVAAWDLLPLNTDPPVIAVYDSGMLASHEELTDASWRNEAEFSGEPGVDDDGNGYIDDIAGVSLSRHEGITESEDTDGHGTFVSGIIAAKHNNSRGIAGVCPQCRIMTLQVEPEVAYVSTLIEALRHATFMRRRFLNGLPGANVRVFNVSAGFSSPCRRGVNPEMDLLISALEKADEVGIVVVGAAPNSPIDFNTSSIEDFPTTCAAKNLVSVTSLRSDGTLRSNSAFGSKNIELAAPGADIYVTGPDSNTQYSIASGTSYAAPHVAAVAALVLQVRPTLLADEVIDILVKTSEHSRELDGLVAAGGIINARRATLRALGDLNSDGSTDDLDIDLLRRGILNAPAPPRFDINHDGSADQQDLDDLILEAIGTLHGDANLDCAVDARDFAAWNANAWTLIAGWSMGNFNLDHRVDVSDYNLWLNNSFLEGRCAYAPPSTDRPPRPPSR